MNTFQINTGVHSGAIQRALREIIIQKGLDYEDHSKSKLGKIYFILGKMEVEKMGKNVLRDSFCEFGFQGKSTKGWREKKMLSKFGVHHQQWKKDALHIKICSKL